MSDQKLPRPQLLFDHKKGSIIGKVVIKENVFEIVTIGDRTKYYKLCDTDKLSTDSAVEIDGQVCDIRVRMVVTAHPRSKQIV